MPAIIHRDQALEAAIQLCKQRLPLSGAARIAIVDDIFARLHLLVWLADAGAKARFDAAWPDFQRQLLEECGPFWSGDLMVSVEGARSPNHEVLVRAREVGIPIGERPQRDRLLLVDRHRSRTSWFARIASPRASGASQSPVVAFYSFKGGLGRTTAAAAYAIAKARAGANVVVVDLDLDAPGIGRLLAHDDDGGVAPWGVLDFLLEHSYDFDLTEYRHVCARPEVTGEVRIDVFPAGAANEHYLAKLAKIDFDVRETADPREHPIAKLLGRIRGELAPDVVVVDCRAGLAPVSGLMLTGLADVHVVFSTASTQAMDGLRQVVHRLGADRVRSGLLQAECVLIQAMVPENVDARERAASYFEAKAEDTFDEEYYVDEADEAEAFWSLDDKSSRSAPHRAVMIPYAASLSDFRDIKDVIPTLLGAPYSELVARVDQRVAATGGDATVPEDDEETA
jgi:MinD-like ATPase involved in chromosome partitioning or flagellar assembly